MSVLCFCSHIILLAFVYMLLINMTGTGRAIWLHALKLKHKDRQQIYTPTLSAESSKMVWWNGTHWLNMMNTIHYLPIITNTELCEHYSVLTIHSEICVVQMILKGLIDKITQDHEFTFFAKHNNLLPRSLSHLYNDVITALTQFIVYMSLSGPYWYSNTWNIPLQKKITFGDKK